MLILRVPGGTREQPYRSRSNVLSILRNKLEIFRYGGARIRKIKRKIGKWIVCKKEKKKRKYFSTSTFRTKFLLEINTNRNKIFRSKRKVNRFEYVALHSTMYCQSSRSWTDSELSCHRHRVKYISVSTNNLYITTVFFFFCYFIIRRNFIDQGSRPCRSAAPRGRKLHRDDDIMASSSREGNKPVEGKGRRGEGVDRRRV